jgi:hypothetical protein
MTNFIIRLVSLSKRIERKKTLLAFAIWLPLCILSKLSSFKNYFPRRKSRRTLQTQECHSPLPICQGAQKVTKGLVVQRPAKTESGHPHGSMY